MVIELMLQGFPLTDKALCAVLRAAEQRVRVPPHWGCQYGSVAKVYEDVQKPLYVGTLLVLKPLARLLISGEVLIRSARVLVCGEVLLCSMVL